MSKFNDVLVAAALASCAVGTAAQTMKPGLWELSNQMTGGSGEMEKGLAEAQKQRAKLPPDQRKMMDDMMAKQGVGMGADGAMKARVCMTQEMIDRNEVATQQGDCQHTTSPRTGNTMKFSFACSKPPSRGEGQVTFVSPEAYTVTMVLNTTATGQPETMNLEARGKFISPECGMIKPITHPRQ